MADWHVGMQVVCITHTERNAADPQEHYPVKGCVYTVSRVVPPFDPDDEIGLDLVECPAVETDEYWPCYDCSGFRPVRKTNIDIFRSLLTPTGQEGPASPVLPVRVGSLPDHVSHERTCQFADAHRFAYPAASSLAGTLAAGLARYADGRPLLSIHCKSSALSSLSGSKQTTGAFGGAKKQIYGK